MTKETKHFPLQEKITRLEEIETYFQQSDMNLEQAMKMHAEALAIAKEVQTYLQTAEQTLEQIDISELRR